jgi:hypothetical protein
MKKLRFLVLQSKMKKRCVFNLKNHIQKKLERSNTVTRIVLEMNDILCVNKASSIETLKDIVMN